MSSAVAELDSYLQSMLALNPPGITGSTVHSITRLCTDNVQDEPVLIQKIYTHFKKAPATHKLGVLYVIDSIARHWVDATRKTGRPPRSAAPDGTFAGGVDRVTKLLPVLMTDIINNAPQDQKEKIQKLVHIWECDCSFPPSMLTSFRQKLNTLTHNVQATIPEGSLAPGFNPLEAPTRLQTTNGSPAAATDTTGILKSLADIAKQSTVTSASPTNQLATLTPAAAGLHLASSVDSSLLPPSTANPYTGAGADAMVNPFAALGGFGQNPAMLMPQPQSHSQSPNPLEAMLSQWPAAAPAMDGNAMSRQLPLLQLLLQQGISQGQWAAALQLVNITDTLCAADPPQLPGFGAIPCQAYGGSGHPDAQNPVDRDRRRDRDHSSSPPGGYGRPSPSAGWNRRHSASPPRRHDRPVQDEYYGESPGRWCDRRGNEYRKRSPPGWKRRSHSLLRKDLNLPSPGPKLVEWEYSIGPGNIKVLSRTLFVSGTYSEAHFRSLFNKFGVVQTCIVNVDKCHAFIKMISRQDAVSAREGVESFRSGEMQLRTRWGVGFGPRDCSDYQAGISVIPIKRLTDADRKWLLTAEYGGTGGRPIQSGMVVEEPDIEIGAGPSSKALSRRIVAGIGGKRGRYSNGFGGGRGSRAGRPDRDDFGSPSQGRLRRN